MVQKTNAKTSANIKKPTAHLTTNKNRVKQYEKNSDKPKIYLEDGQEFEFELHNPTQEDVLAKISMDGEEISDKGIILRPGERVYLDRFIDTKNKFKFDTYEVSDDEESKEAIKSNGDIKVSFFERDKTTNEEEKDDLFKKLKKEIDRLERERNRGYPQPVPYPVPHYPPYVPYYERNPIIYTDDNTDTWNNNSFNFNGNLATSTNMAFKCSANNIETGRIEEGSRSSQEFQTVNKKFKPIAEHITEYKLLPVSQKEVTKEDVNVVKKYCHNCGTKKKPKYNFCPQCGEKQ